MLLLETPANAYNGFEQIFRFFKTNDEHYTVYVSHKIFQYLYCHKFVTFFMDHFIHCTKISPPYLSNVLKVLCSEVIDLEIKKLLMMLQDILLDLIIAKAASLNWRPVSSNMAIRKFTDIPVHMPISAWNIWAKLEITNQTVHITWSGDIFSLPDTSILLVLIYMRSLQIDEWVLKYRTS